MNPNPSSDATPAVPSPGEGRMPKWLFFIWVVFLVWGVYYLLKYALPDLKIWSAKPAAQGYERAK